jgi:hypothetical protein
MSLTCPHCHKPFLLAAVAPPAVAAGVPAAVATQREDWTFPPGAPAPGPWFCPVHRQSKIVPAGVSSKTGKPYSAFWACPEKGCDERPPRGYPVPHAPAPVAPAPTPEPPMPFPPMEPLEEIG